MTAINTTNAVLISIGAYDGLTWTDLLITVVICGLGALLACWLF
ncbi:hypothetical protein pEaSNUABM29_00244 [Erwinia phage pEa_SNUABM_29]|nr:hypothetical protein pEaSNUABM29_00244 [Erwinia phage pEa_SNUABM_29]